MPFGDPAWWETGRREMFSTKSHHFPEMLGPHSTLPSPSHLQLFAGVQQKCTFGPESRALFAWGAQGGEFTWSFLLRDTELLTSCYVCAIRGIYFTLLSLLLHSFKWVMRPTGKEEEERVLLSWKELEEKQETQRKGPQKGNHCSDHVAL